MKYFILVIWILSCGSCANARSVLPEKYIEKVRSISHDLHVVQHSGHAQYTLRLVPSALKVIHAYRKKQITAVQAAEWLNDAEKTFQFSLNIEIPNFGYREFLTFDNDKHSYEEKVKYYSFGFAQHIEFLDKNQKWQPVSSYNFERDFGLSPKGTMLFSVDKQNIKNVLQIRISDEVFGGEPSTFVFDLKKINSLPKLKKVEKWNLND